MSNQTLKNKLFNIKNLRILEEEKPRVNNKIPESGLKKYSFTSQSYNKINKKITSLDLPQYYTSERPKQFSTINSQSNNYYSFTDTNSFFDLNNNVKKNKSNKNSKNKCCLNNLVNKNHNINENILEIVFNNLGIDKIYLEKMYTNKVDFSDLLLLTKDDLKEMNIPIGPRNRILNFILNFSIYKETLKIEKNDINVIKNYFNKSIFISNKIKDYINSPTINIKTKYNNNFSTNLDNSILIKQEIKNYLNNNPHNITVNLNKALKKSKSPFYKNKKNINSNITNKSNYNDEYKRHLTTNSYLENNNFRIDLSKEDKYNNKYKPNSKIKYFSGTNYNKNTKQFIIYDYKNSKSNYYNKDKKQIKDKKKIKKSLYSFSDEGLDLLNKMKENLNAQLNNFTQTIGEKKHLLKFLEPNK
jgi:hypothetical protein